MTKLAYVRLASALSFGLLVACYSPSLPNGKQQCGTNGACPSGYQCGGDNHCYKMGQVPPGGALDMAVPVGDMAMACTAMSCKGGPKPFCDSGSGACVECITDDNCPSGKVCSNKACVPGCSSMHGCPDGGGMCDVNSKMCKVCMKDGDCGGGTPRCDLNSGQCVECLPAMDNCAMGKFCGQVNGVYQCQTGCQTVADCPTGDGGGKPACCNHVCVDIDLDGTNCGGCGVNCGKESCCAGTCSDVTTDLSNCGMCGIACANKHANWSCMASMCGVTTCNPGFGDCNGSSADGCEATLATDPNNCNMCGTKCVAQNAVANCVGGMCGVGICNAGFGNCDGNPMNGCETNVNGDVNNCGMCGMKCAFNNATAACVGGKCILAMCNMGFSDCDNNQANGCEAPTATDINNCGGCNNKCGAVANATVGCAASKCVITSCANGFKDCDMMEMSGCESNTASDVNNCGVCGKVCTPGANVAAAGCSASACTIVSCNAGYANCNGVVADGCEINTTNDRNNCSTCGMVCPMAKNCVNSMCSGGLVETKYGNFTPFTGSAPWTAGYLVAAVPITIPTSTLLRLGIYMPAANGQVILSLYTDNGGPANFVATTVAANTVGGSQEIAAPQMVLPAGTYWVCFDLSVTGAAPGSDANPFTVYYDQINFGTPLPGVFAKTTYGATHYNLWAVTGM